jgi:hypothetical protein
MLPRTILWTRKNAGRERPAASLFVPRQGSKLKSGEPHVESWRTMDSKKQKNKINFRKINHEINARGWQGKVASTKEAHGNGAGNYSRVLPRGEVYVPRSRRKQTSIGKKKNPAPIGRAGGFTKPAKYWYPPVSVAPTIL